MLWGATEDRRGRGDRGCLSGRGSPPTKRRLAGLPGCRLPAPPAPAGGPPGPCPTAGQPRDAACTLSKFSHGSLFVSLTLLPVSHEFPQSVRQEYPLSPPPPHCGLWLLPRRVWEPPGARLAPRILPCIQSRPVGLSGDPAPSTRGPPSEPSESRRQQTRGAAPPGP